MARIPEGDGARRLSAALFKVLKAAQKKSGLRMEDFMLSIGSSQNTYYSLRNGHVPGGLMLLRLIYMLDMDHDEIGKLIDIAGKYAEKRLSDTFRDAPVRATPKTAKAGSVGSTQPAL